MSTLKETIERNTRVSDQKPRRNFDKPDDKDAPDRLFIEAYPCFAPTGGITFRIDHGTPVIWMDASLDEAEKIANEILETITEVRKADLPKPKDVTDAKKSFIPKQVPTYWEVREYDETIDPETRAGQSPVILTRSGVALGKVAAWFSSRELAEEITDRLNCR